MDQTILLSSFISFGVFLGLHVLFLRKSRSHAASKMIALSFVLGLGGCILLFSAFSAGWRMGYLLGVSVAGLIYSFLVFHYIAWFFGMGEAAIRIRLLFELEKNESRGISFEELTRSYNAGRILSTRLARLVSAGHLEFDGRHYEIKNRILLLQVRLSKILRFLLGFS